MVLHNGTIVATWRPHKTGTRPDLTLTLRGDLPHSPLADEAERLATHPRLRPRHTHPEITTTVALREGPSPLRCPAAVMG